MNVQSTAPRGKHCLSERCRRIVITADKVEEQKILARIVCVINDGGLDLMLSIGLADTEKVIKAKKQADKVKSDA